MDLKAQAAERLLRGLGVAVKTFALYPLPHPVTARAVDNLTSAVRRYAEAHGALAVRVTKRALTVDGASFKDTPHASLAVFLFARRVAHFKILPEVTDADLATFVSALGTDRTALEATGGVRHLLRQAGARHIQVTEIALEHEELGDAEGLGLADIAEALLRQRPSPQERERVLEIIHGGPDQVRALLQQAFTSSGGTLDGSLTEEAVDPVVQIALRLDRLLLDEPPEDRPDLYARLASGLHSLREPLRSAVVETMAQRSAAAATRLLGSHLPVPKRASAAEAGEAHLPPEFEFGGPISEAPDGPGGEETEETTVPVDDAAVAREVALALTDALRAGGDDDRRELKEVAETLAGLLRGIVDHGDYAPAGRILGLVGEIARGGGARGEMATGLLRQIAGGPLIDSLLAGLWDARGTQTEQDIRQCLGTLADHLITRLVQTLAAETRGGARAMLCDLIVDLCRSRIGDLVGFTSDAEWFLTRNIANILGRIGGPDAVAHLSRLAAHPDYRVRRETLNGLIAIGTADAQAAVEAFLNDSDERLRLRAIESLGPPEGRRAVPKLVAILEQPDPLFRQAAVKQAALEALGRLGDRQALPAVRRLSGGFALGAQGRELKRLASMTVAILEGRAQAEPRHAGPDVDEDRGDQV